MLTPKQQVIEEFELNHRKMVLDIDNLVSSEFCEEMSVKAGFDREISQEEAKKMAEIIGKVYLISHCNTCTACNPKYRINLSTLSQETEK